MTFLSKKRNDESDICFIIYSLNITNAINLRIRRLGNANRIVHNNACAYVENDAAGNENSDGKPTAMVNYHHNHCDRYGEQRGK